MLSAHCFHHSSREAVARCPSCRRSFCRECITEHEGRVICARCLAQLLTPPSSPARDLSWITAPITLAAGFLSAWLLFYALGWILLQLPSDLHEGTRWQQAAAPE